MIQEETIYEAICSATEEVFSTMLGMEAIPGPLSLLRNPPGPIDGVVSLIGMAGAWTGTGSIVCSSALACKVSAALLMAGEPESYNVNEEVLDSIGEVTNMIIGNVKTDLEQHLGPMGLSIPTVIFGRNFTTRTLASEAWMVVHFDCGAGERMEVKLCLTESREPQAVRHGYSQPASVQA